MSLEITGKLIRKYPTNQVTDKMKKREFVLELTENVNGNTYSQFAKMQLVQNKCDILDRYNEGDMVKVSFNLKGTRYEKNGKENYFTNLDAWKVEYAQNPNYAQPQQQGYNAPPPQQQYNQAPPPQYGQQQQQYGQYQSQQFQAPPSNNEVPF